MNLSAIDFSLLLFAFPDFIAFGAEIKAKMLKSPHPVSESKVKHLYCSRVLQ